jgi:glycine/D-amino acid oxidase-like deaminating enzyme
MEPQVTEVQHAESMELVPSGGGPESSAKYKAVLQDLKGSQQLVLELQAEHDASLSELGLIVCQFREAQSELAAGRPLVDELQEHQRREELEAEERASQIRQMDSAVARDSALNAARGELRV